MSTVLSQDRLMLILMDELGQTKATLSKGSYNEGNYDKVTQRFTNCL